MSKTSGIGSDGVDEFAQAHPLNLCRGGLPRLRSVEPREVLLSIAMTYT
ncbi:hypothetical protein GO003_011245 [Methylicorpusculum oleiharenae]|nr:hypothetical protein [Methylicorpusculum oleiharenae]MCD2450969.1 hypothetical protein [Methylicorpusculum oleiharenae]